MVLRNEFRDESRRAQVLLRRPLGRVVRVGIDHLHRRHGVLALFAVEFRHRKQQLVFLDTEIGVLANRQQNGMLIVARTDAVHHAIGL